MFEYQSTVPNCFGESALKKLQYWYIDKEVLGGKLLAVEEK